LENDVIYLNRHFAHFINYLNYIVITIKNDRITKNTRKIIENLMKVFENIPKENIIIIITKCPDSEEENALNNINKIPFGTESRNYNHFICLDLPNISMKAEYILKKFEKFDENNPEYINLKHLILNSENKKDIILKNLKLTTKMYDSKLIEKKLIKLIKNYYS